MTAIGTAAAVVDRLEPVPATFGAVFAVPEFRVLWRAQVLSVVGDQLARVALSVLTFHRTGSPLLTGAVDAMSYLPAVAGGTSSPPRRPAVAAADGGLRPGADGAGRRDSRTGRAVLGALYAARRRRAAECAVRCGPGGAAARGAPGRPVRRRQCRQQRHHPGRPGARLRRRRRAGGRARHLGHLGPRRGDVRGVRRVALARATAPTRAAGSGDRYQVGLAAALGGGGRPPGRQRRPAARARRLRLAGLLLRGPRGAGRPPTPRLLAAVLAPWAC